MAYKVYMHTFPNGKKYVGLTMQPVNRRWRGGKSYSYNLRMANAINKYGWDNVQHDILADGLTADEAAALEIRLIKELDLLNPDKGYNNAPGGDHPQHTTATRKKIGEKSKGRTHSDEFKAWISEKNRGQNNFMYGKHHTEETKRKISEAKKGSPSPNKGKYGGANPSAKSVVAIDPVTGKQIYTFSSIREAAAFIGRCPSGISGVLAGKQNVSGGYGWRYGN